MKSAYYTVDVELDIELGHTIFVKISTLTINRVFLDDINAMQS